MYPMKIERIILEGRFVRLEPLTDKHTDALCQAISDGELWNLDVTLVPHPDHIEKFLKKAHEAYASGDGLVFATIDKETNQVAGSTRFMKADLPHRRIEIGYTFLGKSWQKTRINTEAKLLMLEHAFETILLNRVEFLTDYLNASSRTAILRLGAKEEGILRNHMVMPNGRIRDSVLYSITSNEWPEIKQHLSSKLG